MAIKIDGQDLLKKFIGGQEIVRIYKNGGEIRPNTVPPVQPTYHIISDFTQGSLPTGWYSDYGSVSYSNNGISLDTTGGTDYVTIKNQNSMPSLAHASRVKIDYDFYRTGASTQALYPYLRLQGGIYENLYDRRSLQSSVFFNSPDYAAQEWHTVDTGSHGGLSFELGKYTLSIDVDLMNGIVTQTITLPNQTTATISRDDVHIVPNMEAIRHSDEFRITLYEGITISDMNMYIWYTIPPVSKPWLCFTANTGGSTIELDKTGNPTIVTLETSTDGTNWNTYTFGTPITLSNIGDKIYWRNTSETTTGFSIAGSYYMFSMTGSISASGDVTSLINKNCTDTILADGCFYELFNDCTSLTTAPQLPATTLTNGCYDRMFDGCLSLTTAPQLPATTLENSCYRRMFGECISLTTAPQLPATTLAEECYAAMFYGCESLTTPPQLPATTLADYCYEYMFQNCTGLTTLPQLPATTLTEDCYRRMFLGCSLIKLSDEPTEEYSTPYRIPTNGTGTEEIYSLDDMFRDTGGTFRGTPYINHIYYTSNTVI